MGHKMAVRDACFNNAGTEFLTASYDRYIKLWDTETGKQLDSFLVPCGGKGYLREKLAEGCLQATFIQARFQVNASNDLRLAKSRTSSNLIRTMISSICSWLVCKTRKSFR